MEDARMLKEAEERKRLLDDELVPLSVAATVTYYNVAADAKLWAEEGETLSRMLVLAAVSLSQVATIHVRRAHGAYPLSARQLHEMLSVPPQRREPVDLDAFLIRRGELRAAIRTLAQARAWFR